jgi:hypothetical protein
VTASAEAIPIGAGWVLLPCEMWVRGYVHRRSTSLQAAHLESRTYKDCRSAFVSCKIQAISPDSNHGSPGKSGIREWDLTDIIKIAIELHPELTGVEKLSHSVREYRNLIHPGYELRKALRFDAEEATIAIEVLHILHRELNRKE